VVFGAVVVGAAVAVAAVVGATVVAGASVVRPELPGRSDEHPDPARVTAMTRAISVVVVCGVVDMVLLGSVG
jgi:hypothetical protein